MYKGYKIEEFREGVSIVYDKDSNKSFLISTDFLTDREYLAFVIKEKF